MSRSKLSSLVVVVFGFFITGLILWWVYSRPERESTNEWAYFLPYFNCFLNGLTATFLISGYLAIKKKKRDEHKQLMFFALGSSAIFLTSYLTYHYFHGDTKFLGIGPVRIFYFSILISHITFSIVQVPLILLTLWFAHNKNWTKHKQVAKITFPIWLFVSLSGILVFTFLKIYN